jgi:tRNA1Val (adenine37-N6)-methyltransferase
MSTGFFRFKQFVVHQEHCAMKVGTDGVLLGATTPVTDAASILDIGTGTGLVALMLAQRSSAHITGIEIDEAAACQAEENVQASPWRERVDIICGDVRKVALAKQFDVIVSNPPFFDDLHCPEVKRNVARHTMSLSYEELLLSVDRLLTSEGLFSVIVPASEASQMIEKALFHHLYLSHRLSIQTLLTKPVKRVILRFGRTLSQVMDESLVIEDSPGKYSEAFVALLHDYYLYL